MTYIFSHRTERNQETCDSQVKAAEWIPASNAVGQILLLS